MQREVPADLAERLRGAANTFADVGFDNARIEDLSVATGVPSSTIYYYLTGKEGLLAFLLSDWLGTVAASVDEVALALADRPAVERLAAIIAAQLRLMNDHPATCRVLLAENGRIARLPQIAETVEAAFHRPVEKVLHEGLDDGALRAVDPATIASAIYGAVTIGGFHFLVRGQQIPEELADQLAAMVLHGIAAP